MCELKLQSVHACRGETLENPTRVCRARPLGKLPTLHSGPSNPQHAPLTGPNVTWGRHWRGRRSWFGERREELKVTMDRQREAADPALMWVSLPAESVPLGKPVHGRCERCNDGSSASLAPSQKLLPSRRRFPLPSPPPSPGVDRRARAEGELDGMAAGLRTAGRLDAPRRQDHLPGQQVACP